MIFVWFTTQNNQKERVFFLFNYGCMNEQLTEIMRLITNLIRTGTVSEVDPVNWLCRVKTGDIETNWINWLTTRAGSTRAWWKPTVGKQVVLLSLGGNLETALPSIPTPSRRRTTQKTARQPCFRTAAGFSTSRKPASC